MFRVTINTRKIAHVAHNVPVVLEQTVLASILHLILDKEILLLVCVGGERPLDNVAS